MSGAGQSHQHTTNAGYVEVMEGRKSTVRDFRANISLRMEILLDI